MEFIQGVTPKETVEISEIIEKELFDTEVKVTGAFTASFLTAAGTSFSAEAPLWVAPAAKETKPTKASIQNFSIFESLHS